jgi:subtilase family serine protease
MVGQILPNNNEKYYSNFFTHFSPSEHTLSIEKMTYGVKDKASFGLQECKPQEKEKRRNMIVMKVKNKGIQNIEIFHTKVFG